MKRIKFLSKLNIVAALLLAFVLLTASLSVTYAIYTNSQHSQRTIAVYDAGGIRFSSNYLNNGNSRDNVRTLFVTDTGLNPTAVVTICNYQQGRQTLPNNEDVVYDITFRLVKFDDATVEKYVPVDASYITSNGYGSYTVSVGKGNASPVTLSSSRVSTTFEDCTLAANTSLSDAFTLAFGTGFLQAVTAPNLYVEAIAEPDSGTHPILRGVFKPGLRAAGASNAWVGAFSDDDANDPDDYDGLNYTISGVGSGNFTFKWDTDYVTISEVSLEELLAIDGVTQTGNSLTFPVDSGVVSRYNVQFYKVDISGMDWIDMNELLPTANTALTSGVAVGYFFTNQ